MMSTENTLPTDDSPSDVSTESVSVNQGTTESTQPAMPEAASPSLDGLKKMAKDAAEGTGSFKPKPVEEAMTEGKAPIDPSKPVYTPNFKYKAALQDKEVDAFWRPLMKDGESEKKVIEALQKLDGFDFVKDSRDKVQKQFESLQSDFSSQAEVVSRVESALQRKDLTSVFRQLGVTEQDIFSWTHQKLSMMELPPEQRKAFEEAENAKVQNFEMQEQMTQFQQMYEKQAVQTRTMQLDMMLSRPEVSQTANSWDERMGQMGAFRDLVIQEAQTAYYQTQTDLSAEQAVQRVMQKFGKVLQSGGGSQAIAAEISQAPQSHQIQVPQAKPVIPNINGKGTAPIKKVPKSLDDLRKMAKELNA